KQSSDLHRIIPMDLHQAGVGMRISIPQPGCCPVRLLGSRASASEVLRASSHAFEVFPAVDKAPPELAVDGAGPAQPQLRQRARRQSQDLGGLTGGQRDRIVSRHQSLTTNQPAPPAMRGYEQD